jgi:hypothetical protein
MQPSKFLFECIISIIFKIYGVIGEPEEEKWRGSWAEGRRVAQ